MVFGLRKYCVRLSGIMVQLSCVISWLKENIVQSPYGKFIRMTEASKCLSIEHISCMILEAIFGTYSRNFCFCTQGFIVEENDFIKKNPISGFNYRRTR